MGGKHETPIGSVQLYRSGIASVSLCVCVLAQLSSVSVSLPSAVSPSLTAGRHHEGRDKICRRLVRVHYRCEANLPEEEHESAGNMCQT